MALPSPAASASSSGKTIPPSTYIAGKQAQIEKLITSINPDNFQAVQKQLETIQKSLQTKVPQVDWRRVSLSPTSKLTDATKTAANKCLISLQAARLSLEAQAKGYLFLHYAILENKPLVVRKLLELGADPSLTDPQGLSAIDHAALQKNPQILSLLVLHQIQKGVQVQTGTIDIATLNTPGLDPKKRAQIQRVLLAQMGALAGKKDPLLLSNAQKALFLMTCLSAVVPLLASSEWMPEQARALLTTLTGEALKILQWEYLFSNTDLSALKRLVTCGLGQVANSYFPALNMAFQAFLTGSLAHSTFQAMKKGYNNIRYRPLDSICYVGAHAVNLGGSCFSTYKKAKDFFSSLSQAPLPSEQPENSEQPEQAWHPRQPEQTVDRIKQQTGPQKGCNTTTINTIASLDPKNATQAAQILTASSAFDLSRYQDQEERVRYLKELQKARQIETHPDKCIGSLSAFQSQADLAIKKVGIAIDTLNTDQAQKELAPHSIQVFFTPEQQREFDQIKSDLSDLEKEIPRLSKELEELNTQRPSKQPRCEDATCSENARIFLNQLAIAQNALSHAQQARQDLILKRDAFISLGLRYRPENPADLESAKTSLTKEELEIISRAEASFKQEAELLNQRAELIEARRKCASEGDFKKVDELTQQIDRLFKESSRFNEEFFAERQYYYKYEKLRSPPAPESSLFSRWFS